MNKQLVVFSMALSLLSASIAYAQGDPIIYPSKGQTPEQMEKDKYECYSWAKQQTGFDPMKAQPQAPPPSQGPTGEVVRGAAKGALAGVAIGAIAGDAGKGAAIGATGGALLGGARRNQKKSAEAQAQQSQAAANSAATSEYNRAFGACLEGRGYVVK
ncbi:MAG: YMGG-like glycine zipper-containing protein [Desulfobulbaceae bacterium]|nr:YMGG-like glycine zipper-containing protein [Desulfobulbaceae bacterium]